MTQVRWPGWRGVGLAIDRWCVRRLDDADLDPDEDDVARLRRLVVTGAAALGAVGAVVGRLWLVGLVPGAVAVCAVALMVAGGRADARAERALPDVVETIARHLRGGPGLSIAVALAAETAPGRLGRDLRAASAEIEAGASFVSAIERFACRPTGRASRTRGLVATALCLGHAHGGATAQALDGVARTIRERHHLAADARALAAQARLSAVVIGLAPLAFALLTAHIDPRGARFLFTTPAGWGVLLAGLGLDALGAWWMLRLSRFAP